MIDMLEKEPLSQKAESSKDRIPENYQLRYFTEMEVAGIMGFPKCFSFPSELTTRQVINFFECTAFSLNDSHVLEIF